MDNRKIFSERLRELIEDDGRSVNAIAAEIGIPQQTLQRYLHCQRSVSMENLVKIALFFDISTDYLLGLRDY